VLAWGILGGLVLFGAIFLSFSSIEEVGGWGNLIAWTIGPFLCIFLVSFLLLDPLLRQRATETPGFARDIIVFVLYLLAAGLVLRKVAGVSPGTILGTGAIAAAILGLSLQQTLGNLFAGLSLHMSPTFQVGDWIEIGGNIRITYIGQVEALTWRCVHLRNENGDTEIIPNLVIAQAVVTNLYVPSDFHRRTGRIIIEPGPNTHQAISILTIALAGIPHMPSHPPEVVVSGVENGGAILEMRWWTLGFRSGKVAQFQAFRLATTCLPREGFGLTGSHGSTTTYSKPSPLDTDKIQDLLTKMELPVQFADSLGGLISIRHAAPGEGIIRGGDAGESLFWVLKGTLSIVQAESRTQPYSGIYWHTTSELKVGDWFGEASLLTGAPRRATVVAVTPCELAEIPKEAFESVLRADPNFVEHLVGVMERRNHQLNTDKQSSLPPKEQWRNAIKAWFGLG